jgi:PmbA protein
MLGSEMRLSEGYRLNSLLVTAEKALQAAIAYGAEQAEIYAASSTSFSIEVENSAIKSATEKRDAGIGIRSVVNRRIGFAYVTTLIEDDYHEAAEKSVKLARASIPDSDFVSLPSFQGSYPAVDGLFDPDIAHISPEESADLVIRAVDASKHALSNHNSAIEAQLSISSGSRALVNSLGIAQESKSSTALMYCYPTVKGEGDQTSGFEYQISRRLNEIDPEWIGRNASENALKNLGGKTIEGGTLPVILTPLAVGTLIGGGFGGAVNAEEVQLGRSYLLDALGSEIASPELTIVDNGLLKGGVGSRGFDAEGYPSKVTPVVEKGVLKSLLHNSYTAYKDGADNTGNASRPSYAGIPSISTTNFIISPGKGGAEDLVNELDKGILCANTGDRPNMVTGELSAMVMEGFYIEHGEIKHALKNTLIGINMKDLLQKISRVGSDTRTTFSVVSPSIVFDSAKVTSG